MISTKLNRKNQENWGLNLLSLTTITNTLDAARLLKNVYGPQGGTPPLQLITSSHKSGADCCFIMMRGTRVDSHDFAASALANGCRVFIGDHREKLLAARNAADLENKDVTFIEVTNSRAAWACLAAAAAGNPQKKLKLAGITGTNGKTSSVWLMRQLVDLAGGSMASIGTLGFYLKDSFQGTLHTSPDPDHLYPMLAGALIDGATSCAMEVSSHSLAQDKLYSVHFAFAAFTSFSRDHLDFHGTEEAYLNAKLQLFTEHVTHTSRIAIHYDLLKFKNQLAQPEDLWVYGLIGNAPFDWTSGEHGYSTVTGRVTSHSQKGTEIALTICRPSAQSIHLAGILPLFGDVFIENFMAALIGAQKITGVWVPAEKWCHLLPVPGRMEPIMDSTDIMGSAAGGSQSFQVLVDYAHTPDALERVLAFSKKLLEKNDGGRLWCVFGCGGDRDPGKRPLMAAAAEKYSDFVIVTTDNPRTENPEGIVANIADGFSTVYRAAAVRVCLDRREAIHSVLASARGGDIVLIAGKGHETYQEIDGVKHPFDDREVVRSWISQHLKSGG